MKNNQKGSAEVIVLTIIGLLVIVPIILGIVGLHINTGTGNHTGYVTAVEKTGVFWKTGRVYIKSDLSSSQEDAYCVTGDEVYNQLAEKAVNKEKVTVSYFSWLSNGVKNCAGESDVIDSVK